MDSPLLILEDIEPEGLSFDRRFHPPPLEGDVDRVVGCVRLRGEALPGSSGIELRARLSARVRLECCRCLEPYEVDQDSDVFLTLVGEAMEFGVGETEVRPEDASLFYVREGRADLGQIAAEQILLCLPLKPICDPACRGLCPTCGTNRNRLECGCSARAVDPRLAPLADLKALPELKKRLDRH